MPILARRAGARALSATAIVTAIGACAAMSSFLTISAAMLSAKRFGVGEERPAMITISPDAVIDAIARHFPDGFDFHSMLDADDQWLQRLCAEFGPPLPDIAVEHRASCLDTFDDDAHRSAIINVVRDLVMIGRLRTSLGGIVALSWEEQARRVLRDMGAPTEHRQIARLASVLAGKVKPGER